MSNARSKLRAFAPAFLEVIEEIENRITRIATSIGPGAETKSTSYQTRVAWLEDKVRESVLNNQPLFSWRQRIEALEKTLEEMTKPQWWAEAFAAQKFTSPYRELLNKIEALERARVCDPASTCTCGSGGHPRDCLRHPWAKTQHAAELSHESLIERVEELERRLKAKDRFRDALLEVAGRGETP